MSSKMSALFLPVVLSAVRVVPLAFKTEEMRKYISKWLDVVLPILHKDIPYLSSTDLLGPRRAITEPA